MWIISALWTRRSIRATTQAALGNTSDHSANDLLVVTYWYLTAVPELMAVAAEKFERFAQAKEVNYVQ